MGHQPRPLVEPAPYWPDDPLIQRYGIIRNGYRLEPLGARAMWVWVPYQRPKESLSHG